GLTLLANRAVGASFVGIFTSTLVITEILRSIAGGQAYDVIDGTLRQPESLAAIPKEQDVPAFNPGITPAAPRLQMTAQPYTEIEELTLA
ncbi:MAG: hypothetical protein ABIR33_07390, partial [Pyrinomonadaceae bacterium]